MSDTPNIGFPLLEQAQAQKEVTVNESLVILDVLLGGVVSRTETAPPGSPGEGDAYIVDGTATGVWAGHEDEIAYYFGGVWNFLPPETCEGHQLWVRDEATFVQWYLGSPSSWGIANALGEVAAQIVAADAKATPVDADSIGIVDSEDGNALKEVTIAQLRAALLGAADALVFKGVVDCSSNPNYPAADAGHVYKVSVAGKIGGGSGPNVEAGDVLTCITDSSASGNHATVGANWVITQTNIDGAVTSTSSLTDTNLVKGSGGARGVQTTGIAIGSNNEISGYRGKRRTISGTTGSIDSADSGVIVETTNGSAVALEFDNATPVDACGMVEQSGAGQITFSVESGGTLRNRSSHTKCAGQYGMVTWWCKSNSGGSAAEIVIGGDTDA